MKKIIRDFHSWKLESDDELLDECGKFGLSEDLLKKNIMLNSKY